MIDMKELRARRKIDSRNIDPYEARTIEEIQTFGYPDIPIQEVQLKHERDNNIRREVGYYG